MGVRRRRSICSTRLSSRAGGGPAGRPRGPPASPNAGSAADSTRGLLFAVKLRAQLTVFRTGWEIDRGGPGSDPGLRPECRRSARSLCAGENMKCDRASGKRTALQAGRRSFPAPCGGLLRLGPMASRSVAYVRGPGGRLGSSSTDGADHVALGSRMQQSRRLGRTSGSSAGGSGASSKAASAGASVRGKAGSADRRSRRWTADSAAGSAQVATSSNAPAAAPFASASDRDEKHWRRTAPSAREQEPP